MGLDVKETGLPQVLFEHEKSTFMQHLRILESEGREDPAFARMFMTIEPLEHQTSVSVEGPLIISDDPQQAGGEYEANNPNNTTKASESPQPVSEFQEDTFDIRPALHSDRDYRIKFMQRLAQDRVWLSPLQKPKSSQNLVVFDWDDTLFPTTHLHPVDENEYATLQ